MTSTAKDKLQLIDGIPQYHKQQQGQTDQTNNTRTKNKNHQNTFCEKVRTIAEELNIKLEAAVTMKKSEWKRTIKYKVQNKIQERVEKEMKNDQPKKSKKRQVEKKGIHSNV